MFKIIAETAFSHEGDFSYLIKQIDAASNGKADYVKFQIFVSKDEYIVKAHQSYSVLDKWILTKEEWREAFNYAKKSGLKILALPLNKSSLEFCLEQSSMIDMYEIHSVCFNDVHLINLFKTVHSKIILGIGGRTGKEVELLINKLNKPKQDVILMYGFQSFPTDKRMLNMKKIESFDNLFNSILGFADHSTFKNDDYLKLNSLAYVMGARYFEKHIVLNKGKKRIDFESAIDQNDFITMRNQLEELELILGDGDVNILNKKEQLYKSREKSVVYSKSFNKKHKMTLNDFVFKISEEKNDFDTSSSDLMVGKELNVDVSVDQIVSNNDFI